MNFKKKAILGLIGALIVGGLGNGVWEYVFEPAFTWSLSGILNVATLGIQTFKDDLYGEIAKGFHEKSSLSLANSLYYWVGYGVAFGSFLFTRKTKDLVSSIATLNKEIDELEDTANGSSEPSEPDKDLHTRISNLRSRVQKQAPKTVLLHKAAYLLFVFGIAFFGWMIIGGAKDRYINTAIVHYKQSLAIVAPLATGKELSTFESRFALIASKSDYEALITDIEHVGDRGGLKLPDFKAW